MDSHEIVAEARKLCERDKYFAKLGRRDRYNTNETHSHDSKSSQPLKRPADVPVPDSWTVQSAAGGLLDGEEYMMHFDEVNVLHEVKSEEFKSDTESEQGDFLEEQDEVRQLINESRAWLRDNFPVFDESAFALSREQMQRQDAFVLDAPPRS